MYVGGSLWFKKSTGLGLVLFNEKRANFMKCEQDIPHLKA